MGVCYSFKSIVGGPCSLDCSQNKVQLSCTKNIDKHKSCYGFQDVGNEVELILAHSATFSTPDIKTMTIWAYLVRNIYHQRRLPGLVSYRDFRETGPRAYTRGSLRYSWINRREGRHRNTKCRSCSMSLLLLHDLKLLTQCSFLYFVFASLQKEVVSSIRCG